MGKIVFNKFFELRKQKGLTTTEIRKRKIITEDTLQRLRKNDVVTTKTIAALCDALDCQPADIMEYVKE